jgi:hypothetical protein
MRRVGVEVCKIDTNSVALAFPCCTSIAAGITTARYSVFRELMRSNRQVDAGSIWSKSISFHRDPAYEPRNSTISSGNEMIVLLDRIC